MASEGDRAYLGLGRFILWWCLRAFFATVLRPVFRVRAKGTETLPPDGSYLLLANHVSTFDTFWLGFPLGRPAHFMASAALFRNRVIGSVLRAVGAFPKQKFARDEKSNAKVNELVAAGQIIQIMPEGVRTWDGRLNPITGGTGRLVQKLGVPVVCARIRTGHLYLPRWAAWPRWVPVYIDYSEPMTWTEGDSVDDINDTIREALTIEPEFDFESLTMSVSTAEGLPTFLWGCPVCGGLDGMYADRRRLSCAHCESSWMVQVDNKMQPIGDEPPLTVATAYERLRELVGEPPVADREAYEADGTVLTADNAVIERRPRGEKAEVVARGVLRLDAKGLRCGDWALPFGEVTAVNMDAGNILLVRVEDAQFRLEPGSQSTWKWREFVWGWWQTSAP